MTEDRILAEALRRLSDLEKRIAFLEGRASQVGGASTYATMIVHDAVNRAAAEFKLRPVDLYGSSTKRLVSHARQWAMYEARLKGLSFPEIGAAFGRDHSTICFGCKEEAERRAKRLPDNENSTKMKAGRNAVVAAPDPDRNRDLMRRSQNG